MIYAPLLLDDDLSFHYDTPMPAITGDASSLRLKQRRRALIAIRHLFSRYALLVFDISISRPLSRKRALLYGSMLLSIRSTEHRDIYEMLLRKGAAELHPAKYRARWHMRALPENENAWYYLYAHRQAHALHHHAINRRTIKYRALARPLWGQCIYRELPLRVLSVK